MKAPLLILLTFLLGVSVSVGAELDVSSAARKIDDFLEAHLKKEGLQPNPAVTDEQFVRRAHLAIIGRIPTTTETESFLESNQENRDGDLISQLLANDEGYTAHHFQFWADLLRIPNNTHWSLEYRYWIQQEIAANTPYDDLARQLVAGHGLIFDNPAASYYIRDTGMPLDNMSNTVRIFLGTRLECAQCHNHPFDKWTQMDYFKMAAYTYGFDHRGGNRHRTGIHNALRAEERAAYDEAVGMDDFPFFSDEQKLESFLAKANTAKFLERHDLTEAQFRERTARGIAALTAAKEYNKPILGSIGTLYNTTTYVQVRHLSKTDLHLPHDYQYDDAKPEALVKPGTMFGLEIPPLNDPAARKKAYAEWLTSPENPRFTQVLVNRLWKRAFGVGLFEPVDDLTDHTVILQPELLAYLSELMLELDYDVRAFQSVLYCTDLFRRQMDASEYITGLPYHFQGPLIRRMSAEQIWDSIGTLLLPDIDTYTPNRPKLLRRLAEKRAVYESLNGPPLEEVLPRVKAAGALRRDLYVAQAEYEARITKAYADGDDGLAKKLTAELKAKTREVDQESKKLVMIYVKDGKPVPGSSMTMMEAPSEQDSETGETSTFIKNAKPRKAPEGLDQAERKRWDEIERRKFQAFRESAKEMARAIDLASPARTGHFLRVFGQSDREVIENAVMNSSVPQALTLLNGPLGTAAHNPNSVLGSLLEEASTPTEKIDIVYRAMFSRKPTAQEQTRILREFEAHGEETIEDLVWALLNSRQFLFIQ